MSTRDRLGERQYRACRGLEYSSREKSPRAQHRLVARRRQIPLVAFRGPHVERLALGFYGKNTVKLWVFRFNITVILRQRYLEHLLVRLDL